MREHSELAPRTFLWKDDTEQQRAMEHPFIRELAAQSQTSRLPMLDGRE